MLVKSDFESLPQVQCTQARGSWVATKENGRDIAICHEKYITDRINEGIYTFQDTFQLFNKKSLEQYRLITGFLEMAIRSSTDPDSSSCEMLNLSDTIKWVNFDVIELKVVLQETEVVLLTTTLRAREVVVK